MSYFRKIKRFTINGKKYWYLTDNGGVSWYKISNEDAMELIDENSGVILGPFEYIRDGAEFLDGSKIIIWNCARDGEISSIVN